MKHPVAYSDVSDLHDGSVSSAMAHNRKVISLATLVSDGVVAVPELEQKSRDQRSNACKAYNHGVHHAPVLAHPMSSHKQWGHHLKTPWPALVQGGSKSRGTCSTEISTPFWRSARPCRLPSRVLLLLQRRGARPPACLACPSFRHSFCRSPSHS